MTDRERDDRKRSLSVSSASESIADLDPREKERDKKGRKNSVFGNLFKKRTKKTSKDEELRELDTAEKKSVVETPTTRTEANEDEYSLRKDMTTPVRRENDYLRNETMVEVARNTDTNGSIEQVISLVCNLLLTSLGCHCDTGIIPRFERGTCVSLTY